MFGLKEKRLILKLNIESEYIKVKLGLDTEGIEYSLDQSQKLDYEYTKKIMNVLLTFPASNADVERVFSRLKLIKKGH